ncbi:metalloproteinase [Pyricularia oryzae 70-15]|uniref:Metalloproteinase n=2 Tax=Pyricularia oryzae TaxID=318829 RepID=G4NFY3_PYRO7|nr:metalloproteinase [Pyricularia oryzae 70-15]AMK37715.1 effector protein AVR-Pita1 [Pyricularia oryzae]EHA46940.1 metalloproteinase [Pyricularia oryzae 70-15]BAK40870.1 effector protein AVR-Pita1 [Pyricularia oryzae]
MLFYSLLFFFHTVAISAFTNIGTFSHPVYDYNPIPNHIHGDLKRRAYIERYSQCSDSQASEIRAALKSCAELASWGYHAVKSNNRLFKLIFKTDSTDIQNWVQNNFNEIYKECNRDADEISLTCHDKNVYTCVREGVHNLAYALINEKEIVICPPFFNNPVNSREITAGNQDTIILHEMVHIILKEWKDYGCEWDGIHKLDSTESIKNPDSYAIFAQCARYKYC